MTGGEILRQILAEASPAPTRAGDKVAADEMEQSTPFPFIIFRRTEIVRDFGLDNTLLFKKETFAIECWDETPAKAQALEEEVVNALIAAGNPPLPNDPDGHDPEIGVNCVVVRADVYT